MSEFSTRMVYFFSTGTFVLNAVKEPRIFWGGCALTKPSGVGVNGLTPCKIVESRRDFDT